MHGYQHTLVNTTATATLCLPLHALGLPVTSASLAAGLLFGTLLVTPDLDLHLNDAKRRWGRLRFIWLPYSALSRHRGMSHTYLLGPTIRLAYLLAVCSPLLALTALLVGGKVALVQFLSAHGSVLVVATTGYYLAQWLHLICDGILPMTKRSKGRSL